MLKPENALKNAEYVGYSTPNNAAKEMLPEETKEDKSFYPDADNHETPRSLWEIWP